MQLGMIGLGRMGGNIVRRLMRNGHQCVVFDQNPAADEGAGRRGASAAPPTSSDSSRQLDKPRAVWVMLPAGEITEATVNELGELLEAGDIIIDGGNAFYKDDIRRAQALKAEGHPLHRLRHQRRRLGPRARLLPDDRRRQGSGRPSRSDLRRLAPGAGDIPRRPAARARDPRVEHGYIHCGPNGAGHFVKMIHNGIEYGLMQAYAEGFDILRGAASEDMPEERRYDLDLADIAEVWRRGSVIGSWLLDLTAMALAEDPELSELFGLRRGFRRRPLDRSTPRSRKRCRPTCCRRRSMPASARARRTASPTSCCRRCATSSAATSSRRQEP